jgi:DNA-binding MarR family transcriptional regulator
MADHARRTARLMMETLPTVMHAVSAEMRRRAHPIAMSHFRALMNLSRGPSTLSDLARRLKVSVPTMSATVTILVNNGWAQRVADAGDRRKAAVSITDEGRAVLDEAKRNMERILTDTLAPLDAEKLDALGEGLQIMRDAFAARQAADSAPACAAEGPGATV